MTENETICKYVTSRGIAKSCNIHPREISSDMSRLDKRDYQNIKNNDAVYVITSALPTFVKIIIPQLEKQDIKIKLVTGASVIGAPIEISSRTKTNYLEILSNSKCIIHWFCQNYDLKDTHKDITPIPLGLDYHTLYKKGHKHQWGDHATPPQQELILDSIKNISNKFDDRINKSFSFFHFLMFHRHDSDRYKAKAVLDNKKENVFLEKKTKRDETWKLCSQYKYIISPHGNGLDCHRTYESMCLGCIPVVRSSSLDLLYKDMPIIILDKWDDFNIEELNKNSVDINKMSKEKIYLKYWVDTINNFSNN